jgi:hypothetical protein
MNAAIYNTFTVSQFANVENMRAYNGMSVDAIDGLNGDERELALRAWAANSFFDSSCDTFTQSLNHDYESVVDFQTSLSCDEIRENIDAHYAVGLNMLKEQAAG